MPHTASSSRQVGANTSGLEEQGRRQGHRLWVKSVPIPSEPSHSQLRLWASQLTDR